MPSNSAKRSDALAQPPARYDVWQAERELRSEIEAMPTLAAVE